MKRFAFFLIAFSLLGVSPTLAHNEGKDEAPPKGTAAKHPFTFEDMMKLKRVNEPVPSPDGKWVVFSAVDVDLAANTKTPHIWIVPSDGSAKEHRLIFTSEGEDRPRWSPDGKHLSVTATYDGSQQVWVCEFDSTTGKIKEPLSVYSFNGAFITEKDRAHFEGATVESPTKFPWARKATSISTEADGQQWSPDGKNILFVSQVYPDCDKAADQDACNKAEDDKRAALKTKAQIFSHLLYRHWKTYSTAKRSHLFVQPVNADGTPSGKAYDITPGDHDVPPFSMGGSDMYAWSPDGKEVAYTSNIDEVGATSTNNEIFIVPMQRMQEAGGGTQATKISTSPGSDSTPRYSPDGKYIAYLSQARAGYESDRFRLMLYERSTGTITELTKGFDRWVGSFTWGRDEDELFFAAEEHGESPIYRITLCSSGNKGHAPCGLQEGRGAPEIEPFVRGHNDDVTFSSGNGSGAIQRLLYTRMSTGAPNEILTTIVQESRATANDCDSAGPKPRECWFDAVPLTRVNGEVLQQVSMSKLEPFWFTGANQTKVEGFLIKPPNFDEHKKYPVKFLIHGGPQGMWGDSWTYRWNAQLFAANGYVVIQINPRGSTGYGQKFIDEINGDWSGKPITDLMMGLDAAIAKYPFIDGNRVCAMGASWGGYAVNWLIGHTNRFKCAVTHDGMFNTVSAYGTTEELWFPQWEFKGNPYTQLGRANYERVNPLNAVKNFKTPTLVSHGQLDYRLDVSQGFELFTALQMQKVPSKLLYFPDEGHWVMKPQNSQLWYKTVNAWVDQWTGEKN